MVSSFLFTVNPLLLLLATTAFLVAVHGDEATCILPDHDLNKQDPNLVPFEYDLGDDHGPEPLTTLIYVEPNVTSFYNNKDNLPASTRVVPKFNGFSAKFINMSNKPVSLYWESSKGGTKHEMRHMNPFTAAGTATFPSHRFLITEHGKPDHVLETFVMKEYPENIYYYDPYHVEGDEAQTKKNLQALNDRDFANYDGWRKTLKFNQLYKAKTGRSYLANYLRKRPLHFMWPAEYFGQEHWVTTKETHIVQLPPQDQLEPVSALPKDRKLAPDAPRTLAAFRDAAQAEMNMTLRVLSCIPRVFEIPNFLSQVEVAHILKLAAGIDLKLSTTGENEFGEKKVKEDTRRTRTSYNSWVARETSPIIDVIYRRAADVLKMDEALFRDRTPDEWPDLPTRRTVAEQLQLVHYDPAQEYTAHHDFGYSRIDDTIQDARFATLLFYLNDVEEGGETSFPRWVNAETFHELKVTPAAGKAVLFYSQLPDGNLDDFSQHAAKPVVKGDKWLINLWVHDPVYGS